jgi:hypothetical protein
VHSKKIIIIFPALNKSGLVFDGRLVIDLNGQTNDSRIFAAGPFTRFRRIYLADDYRHEYYDSAEIGSCVSKHFFFQPNSTFVDPFTLLAWSPADA